MEKKAKGIKKFFAEFKTFITRGNVLDMAVGVIVGGAFTAIVNGLSNFVLKPLINWLLAMILGKGGLEGTITMLKDIVYEGNTYYYFMVEGNDNLFQYSCLETVMDKGDWQSTVHRVAKIRT